MCLNQQAVHFPKNVCNKCYNGHWWKPRPWNRRNVHTWNNKKIRPPVPLWTKHTGRSWKWVRLGWLRDVLPALALCFQGPPGSNAPQPCVCVAQGLRIALHFFNWLQTRSEEWDSMTCENYLKFGFRCPEIRFHWDTATAIPSRPVQSCCALQKRCGP